MRLLHKLLLINGLVAAVAGSAMLVSYAGTRAVGQDYVRLSEGNLPIVAALKDMQVAATAIVGATNELAVLELMDPALFDAAAARAIGAEEREELRDAVAAFADASAAHADVAGRFPTHEGDYAQELAGLGRSLIETSAAMVAALPSLERDSGLLALREALEATENALLERIADILVHEDEELLEESAGTAQAIANSGRLVAGTALVTFVLMAVASYAKASVIVGPIERLTHAAARFAAGEVIDVATPRSRDEIGRLVAAFRSMTEDVTRSQARAEHLALHDPLTGLPNRVLLAERLNRALGQARRFGGSVAVIFLDLDRFKEVNDSLGHSAGDALLREVAHRLTGCVRETDTVARLGGDEFAIVQVGPEQPTDAERLCRRLMASFAEPFPISGQDTTVGVSLGVALAPTDGDEPASLLKHADIALYQAKQAGRGSFRFFTEAMNRQLMERKALERDLRRALTEEELTLAFQPQIELATGIVIGAEALLRWRHPERGDIPPSSFIPLAEETGLIVPIGSWVLRTACARAASRPGLRIAVNLSPSQFRQPDLVAVVARALEQSGLEPERLELEITEGVLITDTAQALTAMLALKRLGVRIAMDDFGTGYSSLSYLRRFPFDKIKIDRSFIADLGRSADAAAIVRSVVGLGCSLGMTTNAEGVEDRAQADLLLAEGCDEVQGFHFARPMAWVDLVRFLGEAGTVEGAPTTLACLS